MYFVLYTCVYIELDILFSISTCKTVTLKENRAHGARVSLRYQKQTRKQSTRPQAAQD